MKIRVIGSGSMYTKYNSASYMIDENTLVDFPNGMCKYLFEMGLNPRDINNVLITHFHGDHYFDLPFYYLVKSKADDKTVNIYSGKEGKKKASKILKLAFPNSTRSILEAINLNYNSDSEFTINNYPVKRILVDHGRMKPAYGYVFTVGNKKVGFTGDTALCDAVLNMAKECDYLFCDCMFIKSTNKHMGIDNIKYLTENFPNCQFVTSHMEDTTREELKRLNLERVIVPNDGDVIEVLEAK